MRGARNASYRKHTNEQNVCPAPRPRAPHENTNLHAQRVGNEASMLAPNVGPNGHDASMNVRVTPCPAGDHFQEDAGMVSGGCHGHVLSAPPRRSHVACTRLHRKEEPTQGPTTPRAFAPRPVGNDCPRNCVYASTQSLSDPSSIDSSSSEAAAAAAFCTAFAAAARPGRADGARGATTSSTSSSA